MTTLEEAFKQEVEETLASKNIVVEDNKVIEAIVDELVNSSDDMWDYIVARILSVSGRKIRDHLDGTL